MSSSSRRLTFAVGTSLLTASLVTGCKKDQPTANPGPQQEPPHVNEGPAPEQPTPDETLETETDGPDEESPTEIVNTVPSPAPE